MSRKTLIVFALATFALCAGLAQAEPVELTVNGDFELGSFDGWSLFPTGDDQFTIIMPGYESEHAGCIANEVQASAALMKQANIGVGVVEIEEEVTISFYARGSLGPGAVAFAEFFSEIEGGGTSSSEILGGAPLALNADPEVWTHFSFTTVTGPDVSGGVTLQLTATTGAVEGSVAQVYYDNASVVVDAVVSAEASTWSGIKTLYR